MKKSIGLIFLLGMLINGCFAQATLHYFDPTLRTTAKTPGRILIGPPSDQRLTAIINGKNNHKVAVIENNLYHVGDKMGEWKIIRIDSDTVYLRHKDQTATIRFKPEQYVKLSAETTS